MIYWLISIFCFINLNSVAAIDSNSWASQGLRYSANVCPSESNPAGGSGGDFTPFPWGNEIPITGSNLQGIWVPTSLECGTYFAFEIRNNSSKAQKTIRAKQFDPKTCTIISSGVGYELEKVFYVSMIAQNGQSFDLTVRAFDRKDLKIDTNATDNGNTPISRGPIVIATLYPRREWSKRVSYPLVKTSRSLRFECENGDALPQDP